jgi:nicotinate-nucleotide adenylyltransferase
MKLGIYGGSFNPPHLGHSSSARAAMEQLELDKLLFIPAAHPPHKQLPADAPTAEDRLAMTALAADGMLLPDRVEVSTVELEREGPSYTADTLEQLHREHPQAQLWLLMGADMLLSLQDWHQPEKILALAGVAAFARSGGDSQAQLEEHAAMLEARFGAQVRILPAPEPVEISSTRLRELLARGEGTEFLHPSVYGYIVRRRLYGVEYDLKHLPERELEACACSMMRAKRIAHVQGTRDEAVRLAKRWGADPVLAARAALLHDCTKYLDMRQQLQLCEQYGIVLDDLERRAVKLLHAKTGACVARDVYGEPEEVYQAIYWHTTGKADMTLLEKILYIADYMEPTRDFPGVERLRALAYQDLDQAVLAGCEMSIEEMTQRGLPVHYNTVEARDYLKRTDT